MLKDLTADNIYIVCGHTDMRKSIDGLAALVQQQFQLDLFASSAFLFCGRRRDRMVDQPTKGNQKSSRRCGYMLTFPR